jgi:uncharacterized protein YerC
MRDEDHKSFVKIAAEKGISEATARRAYDNARPEAVREAAEKGQSPQRGRYSHLGADIFRRIRELLCEKKKNDAEIAAEVHCGNSTVGRVRRQMKAEADGDQAA